MAATTDMDKYLDVYHAVFRPVIEASRVKIVDIYHTVRKENINFRSKGVLLCMT